MPKRVIVFGSINLDLVTHVRAHPVSGETVMGSDLELLPGGKGANQALAAAQYLGDGSRVSMIGTVGQDNFADAALTNLREAGIDLASLERVPKRTGLALISIDESGDNTIVVCPGANAEVSAEKIERAVLGEGDVLLTQQEIPLDAVWTAHAIARSRGCTIVHNAAPASELSDRQLADINVLIVNETEAQALGGLLDGTPEDTRSTCSELAGRFGLTIVLTKGGEGAFIFSAGERVHVPATPVDVRDTTGAGDVFCGTLSGAMADAIPFEQAVHKATTAASESCRTMGAQSRKH